MLRQYEIGNPQAECRDLTASWREPGNRGFWGLDKLAVGFDKPAMTGRLAKAAVAAGLGNNGSARPLASLRPKTAQAEPQTTWDRKNGLGCVLNFWGISKTAQQVSKSGSGCAPNYVGYQKRFRSRPELRRPPRKSKATRVAENHLGSKNPKPVKG